jgi:glycine/D-amino acid oxidase-like deaminating enzyme
MTATLQLLILCAGLGGGATAVIFGVVTVAVRKEERNRTLTGPVPGRMTSAVRRLNGVYVRTSDGSIYSGHQGETSPTAPAPVP